MATQPTDREWILDPNRWPKWPLCPMKKRGANECGVIVGDPDKNGKVFFVEGANIWHYDEDYSRAHGRPVMVDDLLADGWVVD
jgi:hypothetical protein